jgi:hypothetical protein
VEIPVDPLAEIELERSPAARELAERALVSLLHGLDRPETEIIVLGGLVPEVLTSGQDPPAPTHLGTTDVDILLVTLLTLEADLGHVERALERMGFKPVDQNWRWRGSFGGPPVKIEFLCDLETHAEFEHIPLRGCDLLTAQNLRGTGYVTRDWAWKQLQAELPNGEVASVRARFAQLGGYLLSKFVAARTRGAEKDFYDLAYVLLHNRAGGPAEAARTIADGALRAALPGLRSTFIEIAERYRTPNAIGAQGFAAESLRAAPEADEVVLRADAVAAVREFLEELRRIDAGGG